MLRMQLLLLLLCVSSLIQAQSDLPVLEAGAVVRVPHYKQVIAMTLGGDGHYYVTMTASGSTEQFSGYGESVVTVRRFDRDLNMTDEVAFGKGRGPGKVNNVYGILPHPEGIALLTVKRAESGLMAWFLCHPNFNGATISCDCDSIFPMPGHNPTLTNPYFRTETDGNGHTAVAWRSLDQPRDNSLQVLVLDENLQTVHPPVAPFLKWKDPVSLGPWSLLDADHAIFQLEGQEKRAGRKGDQGGGTGLVYHDFQGDTTQEFSISNSLAVPLSMVAARHPETNAMTLAGFCGEWFDETLYLGLYVGTYTGGDTLDTLFRWNVSQPVQEFLTYGKDASATSYHFKRPIQQALEFVKRPGATTAIPLLWSSFLGEIGHDASVKRTTMTQHSLWAHDLGEGSSGRSMVGRHQNCEFGEFRNSWGFGRGNGAGFVVDFSQLKNPVRPYGYRILQFTPAAADEEFGFIEREIPQEISKKGKDFTLVQPRFSTREGQPVTVSRFRNNLRLVRLMKD